MIKNSLLVAYKINDLFYGLSLLKKDQDVTIFVVAKSQLHLSFMVTSNNDIKYFESNVQALVHLFRSRMRFERLIVSNDNLAYSYAFLLCCARLEVVEDGLMHYRPCFRANQNTRNKFLLVKLILNFLVRKKLREVKYHLRFPSLSHLNNVDKLNLNYELVDPVSRKKLLSRIDNCTVFVAGGLWRFMTASERLAVLDYVGSQENVLIVDHWRDKRLDDSTDIFTSSGLTLECIIHHITKIKLISTGSTVLLNGIDSKEVYTELVVVGSVKNDVTDILEKIVDSVVNIT